MKEMVYNYNLKKQEILVDGIYMGYHFLIVSYGTHPCAYVEVPKTHPLYKSDYSEYEFDFDVHCGLTWGDTLSYAKGWYFGWDYRHIGDYDAFAEKMAIEYPSLKYERELNGKKWTVEEIFEDVKKCIMKLKDLEDLRYIEVK